MVAPNAVVYTDDEKLQRYQRRVHAAEEAQKRHQNQARRSLSYYRNRNEVHVKTNQKVRVPLALQAVDSMFAALTAFDVSISITPLGTTSLTQTKVAEQALYVEWLRSKVQEKTDDAVKDALITGIGFVKVTYDYAEDETKKPEEAVIKDRVLVEYIPWDEVYIDPEAKHWRDLGWVAQRLELPYEQVMEDPEIEARDKRDLKADTALNEKWRESKRESPTDDEKRVVLWEMWDFETGTVCLFNKAHDRILKESPNPFAFMDDPDERNPFVPLILRADPGKVVGISDVEAMRPSIDEANVLRSNLAEFVDRFKPKVGGKEGALTDNGKRALRSQEHGEYVEFTPNTQRGDVFPIELPSLPSEAWQQDAKALQDSREAIGLNEVLQGMLPTGRKTATAMNQLAAATETRHSEKRNRMERFYRNIAHRILLLMQVYYEEPRVTTMVDPTEGRVAWDWKAEDLVMEHQLEMTVEPKPVKDNQTRKEDIMMLFNYMGQLAQFIDMQALIKYVLDEFGIPPEVVGTLLKQPEQAQVEAQGAAQQEAAMAQAGQGAMPDPSMMPGPLPAEELAHAANSGEVPGQLAL